MNNKDYNYEIEKLLTQYGDKPDSGVERLCGNCFLYDADHWKCCHYENAEDGGFYDKTESGCWYHRTHEEQKRLAAYIKKHCDEANRLRLDEQRRNGTGECKGCPFRKMAAVLEKLLEECAPDKYRNTRYPSDRLLEEARQALKEAK